MPAFFIHVLFYLFRCILLDINKHSVKYHISKQLNQPILLLFLTEDSANVLNLYSDEYDDVTVNTRRTEWLSATLQDIELFKNPTKHCTTIDFDGIETTGKNLVDASEIKFLHIDI